VLLLNVFLAIAWAALAGRMTLSHLAEGAVIGYAVLWMVSRLAGPTKYFTKVGRVCRLAVCFVWELLVATLRVAIDIATPRHLMRPAILAIPIDSRSAAEITTLANVITLTPGTLSLDISPDGETLYVHAMYAADVEAARRAIQEGLGHQVREVFE
jgi:multicomponent Na+:H+ antiporter subunit E